MRTPAKLVGISGRKTILTVASICGSDVAILKCPDNLQLISTSCANDAVSFEFECGEPGRAVIEIAFGDNTIFVPSVVFREKEFFLAMVISSNYHYGWDPHSFLFGGGPEDLQLEGHAYPKTRQLEKMYHMRNLPITWLIDKHVAEIANESIKKWHIEYADDYAILPTSNFYINEVNYNIKKSAQETSDIIRSEREQVEKHFDFDTNILAIDQWIGSVGTNFTHAAYDLGFKGIWGIGFDHTTCDTSMYHRGCPWDVYKPNKTNYRIPANHDSDLWVFQWTTRDVINTMHSPNGGPGGSVIFSTDVDDVRISKITEAQRDYWNKLLDIYKSNMDKNDFFVFLVHQEDHDCHIPENAEYIRSFLDNVSDGVTMATLEEIALWLNMKYAPSEHPAQALSLDDALDCHEKVYFYCGTQKPDDWPSAGEHYPPHIAYYDNDVLYLIEQGHAAPLRWHDYKLQSVSEETGVYPDAEVPNVAVRACEFETAEDGTYCKLSIDSDAKACGLPIALWDVSDDVVAKVKRRGVTVVNKNLVLRLDLQPGLNELRIKL